MFKKIYLEPENKNFSEIMGNGKSYIIPRFQRDYSWENEQLEELWADIEQMLDTKRQHFMGYLVFQTKDDKSFQIIDGQQRLTTLSIFILAALAYFKTQEDEEKDAQKNKIRREEYHRDYMGVLDTVTLQTSPKLTLNRHNNDHFKKMIEEYKVPRIRGVTATNRKLNKAFEFFWEKIRAKPYSGEGLAQLINDITSGLIFTTITVENDLNAYLVFETLNARGVHLSTPDLLKNYLLSAMSNDTQYTTHHFNDFDNRWAGVLEQLGESNFTNFLRSHIGTSATLPYKKELYRILTRQISGEGQRVIPFLSKLEKNAPVFAALQSPTDDFWKEYEGRYTDAIPHLETLKLFSVKTPLSLLMAAYNIYSEQSGNFIKILKWIKVVSIRYNVICQKTPNYQERIYNELAQKLTANPNMTPNDIKPYFKSIYPDDDEFVGAFREKTMPSKQSHKKILFLLRSIEQHVSGGDVPAENLTLEHVLPSHPDTKWQEYFGNADYDNAIDRLGNMALLSEAANMGQEDFSDKKKMFGKSSYKINQHIASYDNWNIDNLIEHQKWLAKQAKTVWRIDGL